LHGKARNMTANGWKAGSIMFAHLGRKAGLHQPKWRDGIVGAG
jgi:hypothetical protein